MRKTKLVLAHPTANANVRIAANGFAEANLLYRFYTAIACFPGSFLFRISSFRPLSEIRRRLFDPVLRKLTKTSPWTEVGRLAASKGGISKLVKHEVGVFCVDAVYNNLDKHVASQLTTASRNNVRAVYAFEDGALYSFREARRLGMQCFYDLPTGYWRASRELLSSEKERWPEWSQTFTGLKDSDAKLARKEEELFLADHIFTASTFTADTLNRFPGNLNKVHVIPYGFPQVGKPKNYEKKAAKPIKLLFVGKLTQQKGIADLFAAVSSLVGDVQLTLVGQKSTERCRALDSALMRHRWIPSLPHGEVIKQMREHDVLVFPSLFDGFGLVITEAMSQGTPVITTERTGGADIIKTGINGWLVNAGSIKQLHNAIANLVQNPEKIADAGIEAMKTAQLRPWSVYSNELNRAILDNLQ